MTTTAITIDKNILHHAVNQEDPWKREDLTSLYSIQLINEKSIY